MRCRRFLLIAQAFAVSTWAVVIDSQEIGISKRIPSQGDTIQFLVPVVNDGEDPEPGPLRVTMRTARRGDALGAPLTVQSEVAIDPGARQDVTVRWTPPRNGWYRIVFDLPDTPRAAAAELTVPVTARDLYFVWFGAPKQFRWCTVPTTVKEEDEAWWLRRGAIPAAWKGGVCYKEWPVERFVTDWGSRNWIAIDEVGGPGPETDKFIRAWTQLRSAKPNQWIAVWFMGAHRYWADVKHLVDLFVPEIYLNYRSNHLGQFDAYLKTAREAGVIGQVVPGLGINQIKAKKTGRVTNSPTREDVLRQIRYLKRTAADTPGIGFFAAYNAAPGVAEYGDDLCETYYIRPVITVDGLPHPLRLVGDLGESQRKGSVTIRNVGGMDADSVMVEWVFGDPAGKASISRQITGPVRAGAALELHTTVAIEAGWKPLHFRVTPDPAYTILDGVASAPVVRFGRADGAHLVQPLPETVTATMPTHLISVPFDGPCEALELLADGRTVKGKVATLPPTPGNGKREVALSAQSKANPSQLFLLRPETGPTLSGASLVTREGDQLHVETPWYTAEINLASDALTRLAPTGGMDNVLRSPWRLMARGHADVGTPAIAETSGVVTVTIPFDSDEAKGESQYVFLTASPVIRIARSWIPKQPLTLKQASDRCELFQKGGTFALQRGVGGPTRRGRLNDGDAYRDLLFGYLGSRPAPDNADRAGWIDMSYADADGGIGVAIGRRWRDADTKSYDVTRLYDASDRLEVLYLWGKEKTFERPQTSCIYLVPHRRMDFTDPASEPPAQVLWRQLHADQLAWYDD